MALKIVSLPSPTNRRQTVRKVTATSSLGGSVLGGKPSFDLNIMQNPLKFNRKDSMTGGYEAINTTRSRMTSGPGFNSVRNNIAKQNASNRTPVAVPGKMGRESSGFTGAVKHQESR